MKLNENALVYVPSGRKGLSACTHLCIAAHQDDIEIMAYPPIAECYGDPDKYFCGVCTTNGSGSPRSGKFASLTDEEMVKVREKEQMRAADVGGYCAQVLLSYSSADVKKGSSVGRGTPSPIVLDMMELIKEAHPKIVYTHNLADKHDTHVATALRVIEALCRLPDEYKPEKLITLEVWRGLDWVCDDKKLVLDASPLPSLAEDTLAVFESQIAGGKRYDLAAIGRRLANATFFESHAVDTSDSVCFALDATDLMYGKSPRDFIVEYIEGFKRDVEKRIGDFFSAETF